MKPLYVGLIGLTCMAGGVGTTHAITVEELGTGPAEIVKINATGIGSVRVYAGVLKLNVDGVLMDGFCIDPFHFSSGSMSGYQSVPLTSAPKGDFMSAATATEIARLWGTYYSPTMDSQTAAGLQIAIWELVGGSGFHLLSNNDYGASGFASVVENSNYGGPVANLIGLTGPGQDYAIDPVPDVASTWGLLALAMVGLLGLSQKSLRLALTVARVRA